MTTPNWKLEGLKTRNDLLKNLAAVSLIIIGTFITLLQSVLKNYFVGCWPIAIIFIFILTVILSIIGTWGISNIMLGKGNDKKWVEIIFFAAMLIFMLGCALIAFFLAIHI